jgi:hypothetical protein
MLGSNYTQKMEDIKKGLVILRERHDKHILNKYPKTEEDSEGIMYWESPKHVRMEFRGLTPQQGYVKTMSKLKLTRMDKFIKCYIEDKYVVVELP